MVAQDPGLGLGMALHLSCLSASLRSTEPSMELMGCCGWIWFATSTLSEKVQVLEAWSPAEGVEWWINERRVQCMVGQPGLPCLVVAERRVGQVPWDRVSSLDNGLLQASMAPPQRPLCMWSCHVTPSAWVLPRAEKMLVPWS
jgi:hypothetical protein